MKLQEFEKSLNDQADPSLAPEFLLYVPPSGAAVECPTLEAGANAAQRFAARHPGKIVAVYQRVGQAFVSYREPQFTPAAPLVEPPRTESES